MPCVSVSQLSDTELYRLTLVQVTARIAAAFKAGASDAEIQRLYDRQAELREYGRDFRPLLGPGSHVTPLEACACRKGKIVPRRPRVLRRDPDRVRYRREHHGRLPPFLARELTAAEGAVANVMFLAMRADPAGVCDKSVEEIAARSKTSASMVSKTRRKLETVLRLVRIKVRPVKGARNETSVVSINTDHPLGQQLLNWLQDGWSWFRAKAEAAKSVVSGLAVKAAGIGCKNVRTIEDKSLREKNSSLTLPEKASPEPAESRQEGVSEGRARSAPVPESEPVVSSPPPEPGTKLEAALARLNDAFFGKGGE